jgi:CRISPR-associated protein Csb1
LSLKDLQAAVSGPAAAFRSITTLQPVEGVGGKVFPATYSGGVYATEKRRVEGDKDVDCVLLDSVQSQSNRAEEALKHAIENGKISLPLIEVDFSKANESLLKPIEKLTTLDVPHRLADAILRDSLTMDGTRFSQSSYAKKWGRSNLWNATAIYELCPTALVFGMWGSPLKPGGLGAKFERAYVSEIVAVDVVSNRDKEERSREGRKDLVDKRAGFRIDPLEVRAGVLSKQNADGSFEVGSGKVRPSELNHGNILFESGNVGVRCRFAEQTTVISLGALRKLRFPIEGKDDGKINDAGRTVLAALGLCAGVLAAESGTSLRSRCSLWPTADREWELLDKPGKTPRSFRLDGAQAVALLGEAVKAAEGVGLAWMKERLTLTPSDELMKLVKQSQELAAKEKGDGEGV